MGFMGEERGGGCEGGGLGGRGGRELPTFSSAVPICSLKYC